MGLTGRRTYNISSAVSLLILHRVWRRYVGLIKVFFLLLLFGIRSRVGDVGEGGIILSTPVVTDRIIIPNTAVVIIVVIWSRRSSRVVGFYYVWKNKIK